MQTTHPINLVDGTCVQYKPGDTLSTLHHTIFASTICTGKPDLTQVPAGSFGRFGCPTQIGNVPTVIPTWHISCGDYIDSTTEDPFRKSTTVCNYGDKPIVCPVSYTV